MTTVQKRKASGLCEYCGENPPAEGHIYCKSCSEYVNKSRKKKRENFTEEQLEQHRAYVRKAVQKTYQNRRNNKLCIHCGKVKAELNSVSCADCKAYYREYYHKHKKE